jgi:hypothetical protein
MRSKPSLKPISSGLSRGPTTTASGGRGSRLKTLSMGVDLSLPSEEHTRALRQEVNYMVAHSLQRHSESLVNAFERVALRVVQEIMKNQYSPTGPTLGSHNEELSFQTRPPLPYALAAPESHGAQRQSKFDIWYQPTKAVKGQALADLIAERINTNIATLSVRAWAMYFDGSACEDRCGIGILLVSPQGVTYSFSIRLPTPCTDNLAEYEAVRKGMELLVEAGVEAVEVFGDSKLVISQLTEEYRCESGSLFLLWM